MSNSLTGSDLMRETYPFYQSSGYTLEWLDRNIIEVTWNYGKVKRFLCNVDDILNAVSPELSANEAIDMFVYSSYPLDALEASRYGSLGFSSRACKWVVFSIRPDGSVAKMFMDSFSKEEQQKIVQAWNNDFTYNAFEVTSQNLVVEISSSKDDINATHCLVSEKALRKILNNSYDLSDDTYVLIDDNPKGSILIGHKGAVERLSEIPGSNYSLKTYQEIKDELWRKNVA